MSIKQMNIEYDEPIPEVWEMFLRLISDSDKEYKFFFKIISNQIMRIVRNMKEIYEEDLIKKEELPIIREINEHVMVVGRPATDPEEEDHSEDDQETEPKSEETKEPPEGRIKSLFKEFKNTFFKKQKDGPIKKIKKLKLNLYNNPALSSLKQSLKSQLVAESAFTRNSKLESHSIQEDLQKNKNRFRKFIDGQGESRTDPRLPLQNGRQAEVHFHRLSVRGHGLRVRKCRHLLQNREFGAERLRADVLEVLVADEQADSRLGLHKVA